MRNISVSLLSVISLFVTMGCTLKNSGDSTSQAVEADREVDSEKAAQKKTSLPPPYNKGKWMHVLNGEGVWVQRTRAKFTAALLKKAREEADDPKLSGKNFYFVPRDSWVGISDIPNVSKNAEATFLAFNSLGFKPNGYTDVKSGFSLGYITIQQIKVTGPKSSANIDNIEYWNNGVKMTSWTVQ